jgi:hypothetical protein
MPLHCTMVNEGRQIGGYPIRQYKPLPYPPAELAEQGPGGRFPKRLLPVN